MPEVLIAANAVNHSYSRRLVLEKLDMTIHARDRIALVGPNGSGKSTLLRILAGLEQPSGGEIRRAAGLKVAWLPQIAADNSRLGEQTITVADELSARTGVAAAQIQLDQETERLTTGDLSRIEAQAEALEAWTSLGGPDLEARIHQSLATVGLEPAWADRTLATLSGGQMARVNLASLLLSRADVALIDEPGNHLDAQGLELLDELLRRAAPAIVLSSHDRRLLESFAEDVIELKRGRAKRYRGGWASYRQEQTAAEEKATADWLEASTEKRRLVEMERRIRAQGEIGERRARRSGETDKFIRHDAIASSQKNTAASGISKRIQNIEIPEKPWQEMLSTLLLDSVIEVHTPQVIAIKQAVIQQGSWNSPPINLSVSPGERILLTGPNGSGKSSLIGAIAGRLETTSGSIDVPASARIVELAQQGSIFSNGQGNLVDRFRALSGLDETDARTSLATMKLNFEQALSSPSALSPGELTRAELALVANRGASCLLLDEPSNHLDIEAIEALEEALRGWPGALVVASHDRAFRDQVEFDRTISLARET